MPAAAIHTASGARGMRTRAAVAEAKACVKMSMAVYEAEDFVGAAALPLVLALVFARGTRSFKARGMILNSTGRRARGSPSIWA